MARSNMNSARYRYYIENRENFTEKDFIFLLKDTIKYNDKRRKRNKARKIGNRNSRS